MAAAPQLFERPRHNLTLARRRQIIPTPNGAENDADARVDQAQQTGRGPNPRSAGVRAVLTRSGNQCAFPGCAHPVLNERNQFIAELCHIEAAAPGGPRYNVSMTREERRADANLLILCHRHHVETDDVTLYPVDELRRMKLRHEAQFAERPFAFSEDALLQVTREAHEYWRKVERANTVEHVVPELAVPIDVDAEEAELLAELQKNLTFLSAQHDSIRESTRALPREVRSALEQCGYNLAKWDALEPGANPTLSRNWETLNLAFPNLLGRAAVIAQQLELRAVERQLAANPSDQALRAKVDEMRREFLDGARSWGLAD